MGLESGLKFNPAETFESEKKPETEALGSELREGKDLTPDRAIELTSSEKFEPPKGKIVSPETVPVIDAGREIKLEHISSRLRQKEEMAKPLPAAKQHEQEIITVNGKEIVVDYLPKEHVFPNFGWAGKSSVVVREDLSPRVKRFVRAHEIYHTQDNSKSGGWLGAEIRANFFPGLKDPIGLAATIAASLNRERLKLYWQRFRQGF